MAAIGIDVVLGAIAYGASQVFALLDDNWRRRARRAAGAAGASRRRDPEWPGLRRHALAAVRAEEPARCRRRCGRRSRQRASPSPRNFTCPTASARRSISRLIIWCEQARRRRSRSHCLRVRRSARSPSTRRAAPCARRVSAPARVLRCRMRRTHRKLRFIERNCVQCGLCETPAPSRRSPGAAAPGAPAAKEPVTLNEAEPFNCVRCGSHSARDRWSTMMLGTSGRTSDVRRHGAAPSSDVRRLSGGRHDAVAERDLDLRPQTMSTAAQPGA